MVRTPAATGDADWDRFWAIYPRHASKKDAQKAWAKLAPSAALVELILAAVTWQKTTRDWTKERGAYVPYAGSWLRGERWTDEPFDTRPVATRLVNLLAPVADPCQHEPHCATRWAHGKLLEAEASGDPELVAAVRKLYGTRES